MYENDMKDAIKHKWNNTSRDYDQSPGHGISKEEKIVWKDFLTTAIGYEKQKILDVGTGTGAMALILAEMGHSVTGIDLSDGMLNMAREKAKDTNLMVEFEIGDAEKLIFSDNVFDMVINRHLLWTLPNPEKAIKEWYRVLKPEGHVAIIDGNFKSFDFYMNIWRYCISAPLILLTEQKNPFRDGYDKDVDNRLPMRHKERPAADIDLLKDTGFVEISKLDNVPRKNNFMFYLKHGYWGKYFLIKGKKSTTPPCL